MSVHLLDVNVLIALVDADHVQHELAHRWFNGTGRRAFATCPITENGLLRIVGHPKYPNSPGPPSSVAPILVELRSLKGHVFWADDLSLVDSSDVDPGVLTSHSRVTDVYLVALARAHGGRLATFDAKLAADTPEHGRSSVVLIA